VLGLRWWQGVGAIVGVVGIVVAIGIYVLQSDGQQPGNTGNIQSGSGNLQNGSGNCIIQGGSGNNCQVKTTPTPAADPLKIDPSWPTLHGCDGGTATAMLPGGMAPDQVHLAVTGDPRMVMVGHGGASFGVGHLYLDMTVVDGSTVQIEEIKPLFFQHLSVSPTWVFTPESGCGETYSRSFQLDLDKRTFTDQGLPTYGPPPEGVSVPSAPLGPSFHVSRGDPAEIRIDVDSCDAVAYEWGLRIRYSANGHTLTKDIGTATTPYRSVGSGSTTVLAYTYASATQLTATTPVKSRCN
jgi:hypothetical protein